MELAGEPEHVDVVRGVQVTVGSIAVRKTRSGSVKMASRFRSSFSRWLKTAIAVKVVHHNPFADSAREITTEMAAMAERRDALLRDTSSALAAQEIAMAEAETLLSNLAERAHRWLDEAMAAILRERATHGLAGDEAPRFGTAVKDGRTLLFEQLPEPSVNLGPVLRARNELKRYDLPEAREKTRQAEQDLVEQARVTA